MMTQRERRKIARRNAFRYQSYREEVRRYRADYLSTLRSPRTDAMPGSSSAGSHSSPTEYYGIRLADMPESLRQKWKWVKAIEDAWSECLNEDAGDRHGLAFLLEKNFRLTGETSDDDHNSEVRETIMKESGISLATFYNRLEVVTDILVYHAAKRGLL